MKTRRMKNAKPTTESAGRGKLPAFLRQNSWLVLLAALCLLAVVLLLLLLFGGGTNRQQTAAGAENTPRYRTAYLCASEPQVVYYDAELIEKGTAPRGSEVTCAPGETLERGGVRYELTYIGAVNYGYVAEENLTDDPAGAVEEKTVYVRTAQNLRLTEDGAELGALVKQGTELTVTGYDRLDDGVVHLYKVSWEGKTCYLSGEYTETTAEAAAEIYDRYGIYETHAARGDLYGGGDAGSLDYTPREKPSFSDNKMPDPCYCLYLTCDRDVLAKIDDYIAYAKTTKINAFVVNIMDGTSVGCGLLRDRPAHDLQRLLFRRGSPRVRDQRHGWQTALSRGKLLAERLLPLCVGV